MRVIIKNENSKCFKTKKNCSTGRKWNAIWKKADFFQERCTAAFFCSYLGMDINTPVVHPKIKKDSDGSIMEQYGIVKGNTVVLIPIAYTCKMVGKQFWVALANALSKKGYNVVVNASSDYQIEGFNNILPPLSDIAAIVEYAGLAVSIQCGLSDLLVESGCQCEVLMAERSFDYTRYTKKNSPYAVRNMYLVEDENWELVYREIINKY